MNAATGINTGTLAVKKKKKGSNNNNKVWFWAGECKYSVIMDVAKGLGWKLITDDKLVNNINIYWIDVATIHERFRSILPWQMINHFPGMPNIARKNRLGQNLNRMQKMYPREYAYYPKTWVLPGELTDFRNQFDNHGNSIGNKIYIIKPDAGCQGRGIFLTRTFDNVPTTENVVAQVYIKKPLLIDGFKFDLRIYVLVTSVKPLRMYLFQDGLVRLCTEQYVKPTKQNLDNACMHLTNYAVNKLNSNFHQPDAKHSDEPQEDSSKRALLWFMNTVREKYGEAKATSMWNRIGTLCVRTVLSIMPTLSREYDQHFKEFEGIPLKPNINTDVMKADEDDTDNGDESGPDISQEASSNLAGNKTQPQQQQSEDLPTNRGCRCFEILGLDIMLDHAMRPTLIEVNHLPSFGTDSPLDLDIKQRLMAQVLPCLPVQSDDEQAFVAYHKQEAGKRLNSERKGREKELEREKERLLQEERDRQERRRKWRAYELERAAHLRQKLAEAAAKAEEATRLAKQREDDMSERCTPERLEEIKDTLRKLYEQYSPEKVAKIDKLLSKYMDREEEFLRFALLKYCPTFLLDMEVKKIVQIDEAERMKAAEERQQGDEDQEQGQEQEVEEDSNAQQELSNMSIKKEDNNLGDRSLASSVYADKKKENKQNFSTNIGVGKSLPTGRSTFGTGRNTRSLSPTRDQLLHRRFGTGGGGEGGATGAGGLSYGGNNSINDANTDAAYRAKIISTYVPTNDDEWLKFEAKYLKEFTRIFPKPNNEKSTSNSASISSNLLSNEEAEEDSYEDIAQDDDGDDENNTMTAPLQQQQQQTLLDDSKKIKFIPASYEDILVQVFTQDKRQFMRLHGPTLANSGGTNGRSNVADARESQSLPPLPYSKSNDSNSKNVDAKDKVDKKDAKLLLQTQMDAANRLSKGMTSYNRSSFSSSSSQQSSDIAKNIALQHFQEELMDLQQSGIVGGGGGVSVMDSTNAILAYNFPIMHHNTMASGGGSVYADQRAYRMMEESRLAQQRLEQVKLSPPILLPASSLKQQLFHFDPILTSNTNPMSNNNVMNAMGPTDELSIQGGIRGVSASRRERDIQAAALYNSSISSGVVGRSVPRTVKLRMPSEDSNSALDTYSTNINNNNTNSNRRISASRQQRVSAVGGGGDERTQQEAALRNLFPGFF